MTFPCGSHELNELLECKAAQLRHLCPPIEAFGIGGSVGAGAVTRFSDLDFFILLPDRAFFRNLHILQTKLLQRDSVLTWSPLDFQPGLGFQISTVLTSGLNVEYFINSRETLTIEPMRKRTQVLYDRTGYMTAFISSLPRNKTLVARTFFDRASHDYLVELIKIRKHILQEEIIPVVFRLNKLRRILISLDRYHLLGELCSPHDADRHLQRDLGRKYFHDLNRTLPSSHVSSIFSSFLVLRSRILRQLRSISKHYLNPSRAYYDLESELFKEIHNASPKKQ